MIRREPGKNENLKICATHDNSNNLLGYFVLLAGKLFYFLKLAENFLKLCSITLPITRNLL